jgi:glycosyltransferase involved in cell wall biosynthesis
MKVVHLVAGSLTGGAARGAYWLHRGLIKTGNNSILVTNGQDALDDPSVVSLSSTKVGRVKTIALNQVDNLLLKLYSKKQSRNFSTGFFGRGLFDLGCINDADIIHLHWINGLVSLRAISSFKQPIVWTIRDMWPFTGGCHYAMDCTRYTQGCGECPELQSRRTNDISCSIVKKKLLAFKNNIQPVGISHWVTEQAQKSTVFVNHNPITILNNVDTDVFSPLDKELSRDALSIKTNKKVILLGATNVLDFYKGFSKAIESLSYLDKTQFALCVFGSSEQRLLDEIGFEYYRLGYLNDNISLRLAYSAADVFVAPSIMEAFGKTLAESLSCGTPVVCFDATGPKSIVEHKVDGYRARAFDVSDLAEGIRWVVNDADYMSLRLNARQNAVAKFDSLVIANQYKELYDRMLET